VHLNEILSKNLFANETEGGSLKTPFYMNRFSYGKRAVIFAVSACLLAAAGGLLWSHLFQVASPFILFVTAIFLSGWFAGYRSAVYASVLSVFLAGALFSMNFGQANLSQGELDKSTWYFQLALFVCNGVLLCTLCLVIERIIHKVKSALAVSEESQIRFRSLAELMPQLVFEADSCGKVLYMNHHLKDILSFESIGENLGSWSKIIHSKDVHLFRRKVSQARKTGRPFETECRFKNSAGVYRWFIARAIPSYDDHGRVERWLGTCTDIEQQKKLQDGYEKRGKVLRQLAENIRNQVFYVMDLSANEVKFVSRTYEKIWGRPIDELYQRKFTIAESIHPEDLPGYQQACEQQNAGSETSVEYRIRRPDGTTRWIADRAFPIKDEKGAIYRITGLAEDITEHRLIEEEKRQVTQQLTQQLNATVTQYRSLFIHNPQPMWIIEPETFRFLEVNDAAVQHYGYSRQEFLKMSALQIKPIAGAERDLPEMRRPVMEGFLHHEKVFKHVKKDGSIIDVQVAASDIEFQGSVARLVLLMDVTEQIRADKVLLEAKRSAEIAKAAAESANEAKTRFLANMSHEIRTPLGAMLGFVELLRESQTAAERDECVQTILRNGHQLSHVVNDILDLSKIESDNMQVEQVIFNPTGIVNEVVSTFRLQAQVKALELNVTAEGLIPARVCSDSTKLRQILMNIVGNAVKFTQRGHIEIVLQSLRTEDPASTILQFLIKDTGQGISKVQKAKLFKPFSQADTSTTRLFGGTGLGLVLSKRLAQALGGDLILQESEPDCGSCFAISIRAILVEEKRPDTVLNEPVIARQEVDRNSLFAVKVLLVEDAADNRALVSRFVKSTGGHIVCAENGIDGVEAALHGDFDVVLMDIQMPRLDGCGALKQLRLNGYAGPIVALTAHAMNGDRELYMSLGFNDYLVKPLQKAALIDAIGRHSHAAATIH